MLKVFEMHSKSTFVKFNYDGNSNNDSNGFHDDDDDDDDAAFVELVWPTFASVEAAADFPILNFHFGETAAIIF